MSFSVSVLPREEMSLKMRGREPVTLSQKVGRGIASATSCSTPASAVVPLIAVEAFGAIAMFVMFAPFAGFARLAKFPFLATSSWLGATLISMPASLAYLKKEAMVIPEWSVVSCRRLMQLEYSLSHSSYL